MSSRMQRWLNHAANHRTCFGFGVVLIAVHLVLIAERVYRYRHFSGWVVTARASGQCLHFDCALVLALTLRRSITWLRTSGMDWLLPLDRHIYFHKMMGWAICFFSVVHTLAHVINYGIVSRTKGGYMSDYLFDRRVGWIPGMVTPTGLALLFILLIMGLFSHRMVRKSGRFELFYWTHLLWLPFFLLLIMHGGNVWKWMIGPLAIYAIEFGKRLIVVCCSDRGRGRIISLRLLPNQVVKLKIERPCDFDFHAGDYVYVNIPDVAKFEWHPFTISSAPEDEDYITLHVRVAGGWTGRLYSICQEDAERILRQQSFHRIAQQQINANKLNPFSSLVLTNPREEEDGDEVIDVTPSCSSGSSSVTAGKDNMAYQSECSSPSLSDSSISSTEVAHRSITVSRMSSSQLPRYELPIFMDGPYSGSSTRAWNCRYALFIAGGIGVTPFASLLQSLVSRYKSSMSACPHCLKSCCTNIPASLGKLRHVDFMWINRDPLSFQWFLELLLDLDREQAVRGSVMAKFIDIQLYQTGAKSLPSSHQPCSTCSETLLTVTPQPQPLNKITTEKADPLEPNMVTIPAESAPLVKGRCSYCTMRQMQHLLRYGRPVWDEVFREVAVRSGGRVTVFYCGPVAMGRVVMDQCKKFGFTFTKEIS